MRPADALIISDIAGLYPWVPASIPYAGSSTSTAMVQYSVRYTATKDPPIQRAVIVTVTELPNPEWARYNAKYPQWHIAVDSPQSLTNITKFNQTVIQNTYDRSANGDGRLCFMWPSGNFTVSVCYDTPQVNEEFLRRYLEKYPSSL